MTEGASRPLAQFQRVAQVVRHRIRAGTYPVGSQLPSIASLASEFQCSHMTIKQALTTLSNEGAITSRRGVRAEVAAIPEDGPTPTLAERLSQVEAHVSDLTRRLDALEHHDHQSTDDRSSAR